MSVDLDRERTVQLLCHQYAQDHLTTEELESRLDAAYRATTPAELRALLADLPAVALDARDAKLVGPVTASHGVVPAERRVLSMFADVKKRGEWEVGAYTRAVAVFAALELDFREARIPPGTSTIDVTAVFAEVKIIVPPGLAVECDGSAIFGEFKDKSLAGPSGPDVPTLHITGTSVFAEVSVKIKLPELPSEIA